jgi:hypothetical protein
MEQQQAGQVAGDLQQGGVDPLGRRPQANSGIRRLLLTHVGQSTARRPGHRYSYAQVTRKGSLVILAYRPVREIEKMLNSEVTDVRLVDGNVETYFDYNGRASKFTETPEQVFQALRITAQR